MWVKEAKSIIFLQIFMFRFSQDLLGFHKTQTCTSLMYSEVRERKV